ncbi:unnamed protein product, partial [Ectocarpus sp. 12 AP-2014]
PVSSTRTFHPASLPLLRALPLAASPGGGAASPSGWLIARHSPAAPGQPPTLSVRTRLRRGCSTWSRMPVAWNMAVYLVSSNSRSFSSMRRIMSASSRRRSAFSSAAATLGSSSSSPKSWLRRPLPPSSPPPKDTRSATLASPSAAAAAESPVEPRPPPPPLRESTPTREILRPTPGQLSGSLRRPIMWSRHTVNAV